MAIVIDPGAGAISRGLEQLGAGIARMLFAQDAYETSLINDPARMQVLASGFAAAREVGPEAVAAAERAIKVRPGFAEKYIFPLYRESFQQQVERLTAQSDLAQRTVKNAILKSMLETGTAEAALKYNLPELEALGLKSDIVTKMLENDVQGEYWTIFKEEGGPRIRVQHDLGELGKSLELQGITRDQIRRYAEAVNSIDQSTPQGRQLAAIAAIAPMDPTTAQALMQFNEQSFRAWLANMQTAPTPEDILGLTVTVHSQLNDLIKEYNKNVVEDADSSVIAANELLINNWYNIAQELMSKGYIHQIDLPFVKPRPGKKRGELAADIIVPASVTAIEDALDKGEISLDEVARHANDQSLFPTTRERAALRKLIEERAAGMEASRRRSVLGPLYKSPSDTPTDVFMPTDVLTVKRTRSLPAPMKPSERIDYNFRIAAIAADPNLSPAEKRKQIEQLNQYLDRLRSSELILNSLIAR
jgi:hypothetical protein